MENTTVELSHHSRGEIANQYACQKIIKSWIEKPNTPSSQVIPSLHKELMQGVDTYQRKGLVPLSPGAYRGTEVTTEGRPNNFFVAATDVIPVMQQYTKDLDMLLQKEASSPLNKFEETIHDAAWAYYVFARIHPYLDGNGRVGRMILKRVMKGRGYKDIIFQTDETEGRALHLQAMNAVHDSGNLAHLELYLLKQLEARYEDNSDMQQGISRLIIKKKEDIASQSERKDLTEVWSGFKGLHLHGVKTQNSY